LLIFSFVREVYYAIGYIIRNAFRIVSERPTRTQADFDLMRRVMVRFRVRVRVLGSVRIRIRVSF